MKSPFDIAERPLTETVTPPPAPLGANWIA
jgi:hypothetical protein